MKRAVFPLLLLLTVGALVAQAGRGGIAGRVTTDLNDPAAGVTVQMKDMAGKDVTVTGALLNRNGMKAIEATAVQLASK